LRVAARNQANALYGIGTHTDTISGTVSETVSGTVVSTGYR
jgi:hypothetical protein